MRRRYPAARASTAASAIQVPDGQSASALLASEFDRPRDEVVRMIDACRDRPKVRTEPPAGRLVAALLCFDAAIRLLSVLLRLVIVRL